MNNSAKLGGWLDNLLNVGTQLAPTVINYLQQAGASSSGGAAKGYVAIKSACDSIIGQLAQIKAQVSQLSNAQKQQIGQQAIAQAQGLAAALSNSQVIYQAKNGKDGDYLAASKAQAAQLVQQIGAILQGQPASNTPVNNTPVNNVPVNNTPVSNVPVINSQTVQIIDGIDNTLLIGGVILTVLLLK
jgi:hypothetical protein